MECHANDVRAAFFVIRYMKTVIRYMDRAKVFTKKYGMVLSDYRQKTDVGRKQMCNVYNKVADKTAGGGKHEKCKS